MLAGIAQMITYVPGGQAGAVVGLLVGFLVFSELEVVPYAAMVSVITIVGALIGIVAAWVGKKYREYQDPK